MFLFFILLALACIYYRQHRRYLLVLQEKQRLVMINQAKDQLSSIIAHDLRAFLSVQKINISKLKHALGEGSIPEAISFTEITETISNRTHALLNNLLYWSLSQTGQLSFMPEKLRLRSIIEQVCYDFAPLATNKKIDMQIIVPEHLYFISDLNSIKVVFRNLIDNAIKYTPPNGSLIISATEDLNVCRVSVKDSGIGMDEKMIAEILTSEIRLQGSAYDKRSTGLGLWLSRHMTEKNGGRLFIISRKAHGTEMIVTLPRAIRD